MTRHVALGGSGAHQRSLAHVGSLLTRSTRLRSTVIGTWLQRSRADHSAKTGASPAIWRG
jgi:hypothetical protein